IGERVARRTDDAIALDLADWASRRDRWRRAIGQRRHLAQPVDDLRFRLIVTIVIRKFDANVREAEQRDRPDRSNMTDARHLNLDRNRDIALDLFSRCAGVLSDGLDAWRHWVGIGFDIEFGEANEASDENEQQQRNHQDALLQREGDDCVHVLSDLATQSARAARSIKTVPLVTTLSPAERPART